MDIVPFELKEKTRSLEYAHLVRRVLNDPNVTVVEDATVSRQKLVLELIVRSPIVSFYKSGHYYAAGIRTSDISQEYLQDICKGAKTVAVGATGNYIILRCR